MLEHELSTQPIDMIALLSALDTGGLEIGSIFTATPPADDLTAPEE